ncbi:uncharacterized protein LOC117105201 [Anneissia japonica]|uniref:uncharacterized protein LOC117105201 n=1 Tax=Anneissia japonica TaxID=1529436 RepID=UPI0014256E33|nr:uncharacterized protein LOC117105201 [Anneissia japonica]
MNCELNLNIAEEINSRDLVDKVNNASKLGFDCVWIGNNEYVVYSHYAILCTVMSCRWLTLFSIVLQDGNTPLHKLLQFNHSYGDHIDATNYLIKAGANAKLKNQRGQTPAEVYVNNKCEKYDSTNKEKQKEMLMHLLQSELFIRT